MYIFGTTSLTGRRECDKLISACARMQKSEPDFYPVVKLDVSGFEHRDSRIGWVRTPCFTRVGKAPKSDMSESDVCAADDLATLIIKRGSWCPNKSRLLRGDNIPTPRAV